jgi:hypothetical protein
MNTTSNFPLPWTCIHCPAPSLPERMTPLHSDHFQHQGACHRRGAAGSGLPDRSVSSGHWGMYAWGLSSSVGGSHHNPVGLTPLCQPVNPGGTRQPNRDTLTRDDVHSDGRMHGSKPTRPCHRRPAVDQRHRNTALAAMYSWRVKRNLSLEQ